VVVVVVEEKQKKMVQTSAAPTHSWKKNLVTTICV